MKNKTIIHTVIGVVFTFVFLYLVYGLINNNQLKALQEITKIKSSDYLKWSTEKKNVLIEYSDFQCPACKAYHDLIKKEIEVPSTSSGQINITKKVTLIFRHFPLYQIHPNAFESAYAAEAAGHQGKFYQMVDLLFAKQDQWTKAQNSQSAFIQLAQELKLDVKKFTQDLSSTEVKAKVDQDLKSGEDAGINSTPTFFLDGQKLELTSFDQLKKLLSSL